MCGNSGFIHRTGEDGVLYSAECPCMAKRRSLRRMRRSGMTDLLRRYTFESYRADSPETEKILRLAKAFAEAESGWFYIAGRSGSGKSHICTAICGAMLERNIEIKYMAWRDESTELKALVTDPERYARKMRYIDDFLKGGDSDADLRLAFEILNHRYNDTRLRTILSSETELGRLMSRDEALGGRIYERSRGWVIQAPGANRRLQ